MDNRLLFGGYGQFIQKNGMVTTFPVLVRAKNKAEAIGIIILECQKDKEYFSSAYCDLLEFPRDL